MDIPKPTPQHQLLTMLAGDWTFDAMTSMGPDHPAAHFTGRETVRSLGELWIICEAVHHSEGDVPPRTMMTLGFDPAKGKFVGTFIASMMTYLWPYEGDIDPGGSVITLASHGPSFSDPSTTSPYRDVITVLSENERLLTSHIPSADGKWVEFMRCHYKRVPTH